MSGTASTCKTARRGVPGPREQEMMDECPWCFHDDRGGSTGTVERDCPRCETSVVARYLPQHLTRCNGGEQQ